MGARVDEFTIVAVVLAVALTSGPDPGARHVLRTTAVAVAAPLAISLILLARPGWERDPRVEADLAIARWYRAHRPSADADLLPVCASATWYVVADATARTPYLWVDHVRSARGSPAGLVALGLAHPDVIKRNRDARDGDVLILGKPLGVGILGSAMKKGLLDADGEEAR